MPTIRVLIKGKVQGVYYRASAKEMAEETGVTGWVRNTEEGDVEALASGTAEQLQKFIDWCRIGPSHARVTNVIVNQEEEQVFEKFRITRG